MSIEWLVFAVWLAGALAMFGWMLANEWPSRHEDARSEGLPTHDAFLVAAFAATAAVWFALPAIRYLERRRP